MKAIVLAAGLGARMRPLTNDIHKSLLRVGETTILGQIIDGLLSIEVEEIVVVTGYLAEQVEGFLLREYPSQAFRFVRNERFRETNNIVSLSMAFEVMEFNQDVVLIECDLLFHPAILQVLTTAERGNIALVDRYKPGMDGTVVSVDNGIVTQVFPTHLQGEGFEYRDKYKTVNIYRFDREFCRKVFQPLLSCYANIIDSGCYYELVLGMLINMQRQVVRAELVDGSQWVEVDDPNDLAVARFRFEPARRSRILAESHGGYWNFDILDFAYLRNMYFPTDAMIAAIRRALPDLVRNYGSSQAVLNEKLSLVLKCDAGRIQCLNGASQIYPELRALLPAGRTLLPTPTFNEYPRWLPAHETYLDEPGIDYAALVRRAGEFAVVVIVNPNNPTGTTIPTGDVHALIAANPATMFVVDESFMDFSGQESLLQRLEREPLQNVLVIASLSKSLGIPGLRLGYVYACDARLIARVGARLPVWNVNSVAEFYLELLPKFQPELAASYERSAEDKMAAASLLREVSGVESVYAGGGNFILVRLVGEGSDNAGRVAEYLLQRRSILVKDVSSKFHPGTSWLRLAVRKPAENVLLIEALNEALLQDSVQN